MARGMDGGYGWVILVVSFIVHMLCYGVSWTVGVFNVIFLDEFGQSKADTAWAGSLLTAMMYLTGPLASVLTSSFGARPSVMLGGIVTTLGFSISYQATSLGYIYLSFSFLVGLGLGIAYIPSVVIISKYFERRRTIALGLAVSGVGLGTFVYPPIIRSLVHEFGWRGSLLMMGGISLNISLCGMLMRPNKKAKAYLVKEKYASKTQKQDNKECTDKSVESEHNNNTEDTSKVRLWDKIVDHISVFKNAAYLTLCANNFLYCFGLGVVYVHIVAFAKTSGVFSSEDNAALILSAIGVSNLVGRIVHGVVCHFPRMTTILVYMVSSVISGVATLFTPISLNYIALSICSVVFGFCSSCLGALLPDIIIRIVGIHRLGSGYGFLLLFEGAGAMLGPPAAGLVFDWLQSYDGSFYLAGTTLIAAGVVMFVPWRLTHGCDKCIEECEEGASGGSTEKEDLKFDNVITAPDVNETLEQGDIEKGNGPQSEVTNASINRESKPMIYYLTSV